MLTVVALHDRLGVKPLFLEARLPFLALAVHHQVLHTVDETEMHILQPVTTSYHIKECVTKFSRLGAELSKFVVRTLTWGTNDNYQMTILYYYN